MNKQKSSTNWITWVNRLAVFLVSLLAIGAFVLSYNSLYEVAKDHRIPVGLAWIWPLLIDGAIVVFSISVVRASLLRESAKWAWALVIVFTMGTIFFNILHFVPIPYPLVASITIAIIAPVGLVLAFETVMGMIKSNVARYEIVQSIVEIEAEMKKKAVELDNLKRQRLAEIEEEGLKAKVALDSELGQLGELVEARRQELANLEGEIGQQTGQLQEQVRIMEGTIQSYQQDIEAKQEELKRVSGGAIKVYLPANLSVQQRQELTQKMGQDGLTNEAIAEALGVSVGTVKNDKRAVKVEVNGKSQPVV